MSKKLAVIVGAGPGVGNHVAKKFGLNGFRVILISRSLNSLNTYVDALRSEGIEAYGITADAGCVESLEKAFDQIKQTYGVTDVLVYNAVTLVVGKPTTLTPETLLNNLSVDVAGALTSALQVIPDQRKRKEGTILFTGGSIALHPSPDYSSLSIGKAAMRNLALTLAAELAPEGIFVGTVTISGVVQAGTDFDPERIANVYWDLFEKRDQYEVIY
ncbi:SDR family NAD(P)-dependent oxidoreductase [Paenibacillus sp. GCM10012306]|uniref:SDR family NAD(P)-dependent oxidoreductase n=1 Tax=Paenibacillus sp. GCM10012306 TaxID=3317342 RepID=UPI0036135409